VSWKAGKFASASFGVLDPKKGGIRARALKPCQIKVFFSHALWIT
jgi:hypothetical protein